MSDYPMLISNKLHSFRNFIVQSYANHLNVASMLGQCPVSGKKMGLVSHTAVWCEPLLLKYRESALLLHGFVVQVVL